MAALSLVFDLMGRDVSASKAFSKVGDSAERAGKQADGFGSVVGKAMKTAGAAIAGIGFGALIKQTVGLASASEQSMGGVQAVFKDYARTVVTSSKNADQALGLSQNAYRELATVIGSQLKNAGVPMDELAGKTDGLIATGADLAAMFGGTTKEAVEALSSALKGEMDPIERYGISLNDAALKAEAAALGLDVMGGSLTNSQRAMAVMSLVTKQSADATGAFGREQDTAAGKAARAAAQWENLQIAIGEKLLPAFSALVDLASDLMPVIGATVDVVAGAVTAFNDLPGPVKAAVVAMGAMIALRGPMANFGTAFGSMADTARLKMMYLRDAVSSTSAAATTARRGMSGLVGLLGGPWGIAITGAVTGLSLLASGNGDAAQAEAAHEERVRSLTDAFRESNGVVTESIRMQVAQQAQNEGLFTTATRAGLGVDTMTDALLGNEQSLDRVVTGLRAYAESLRERGEVGSRQRDEIMAEAVAVDEAVEAIIGLSGETGIAAEKARELERAVSGVTTPTRLLGQVSEYAAGLTGDLASAAGTAADQIGDAKRAVDTFNTSLDILTGGTISAIEAESNFQAAVDAAKDAVDDLDGSVLTARGSLNLQSESGRRAADVLLDVRNSGNQLIATLKQQGATEDEVRAADRRLRESFIETARQMGIGQREAEELADDILGIPSSRTTAINAKTAAANKAINFTQDLIDGMRGKTITVQVRAAGRFVINPNGGLQEFGGPDALRDFAGRVPGYMRGGWTGPGPRNLLRGAVHADEFVVPKDRVNALGGWRSVAALVGMGKDIGGPTNIIIRHDTRHVENAMESMANAMENATKAGVAGSGSLTGAWGSIWQYVKARVPAARINSTFRAGDPGYHGRGKAIDFGYGSGPGGLGSAGLARINRVLHDGVGRNLAELIYNGIGDDRPNLKNGRPLAYSRATQLAHRNHVHAAVFDSGGILPPGVSLAVNGTGQNETIRTAEQERALQDGRPIHIHFDGTYDLASSSDLRRAAQVFRSELVKLERQQR